MYWSPIARAVASARKSITSGRIIVPASLRDAPRPASRRTAAGGSAGDRTSASSGRPGWSSPPKSHISRFGAWPCTRRIGMNVANWNQRDVELAPLVAASGVRAARARSAAGTEKPPVSDVQYGMPDSAKPRPAGICLRIAVQVDDDVARPRRRRVALLPREAAAGEDEHALVGRRRALPLVDALAVHQRVGVEHARARCRARSGSCASGRRSTCAAGVGNGPRRSGSVASIHQASTPFVKSAVLDLRPVELRAPRVEGVVEREDVPRASPACPSTQVRLVEVAGRVAAP